MSSQMPSVVLCSVILLSVVGIAESARVNRHRSGQRNQDVSVQSSELSGHKECIVLKTRSSNRVFQGHQKSLDNMLAHHNIRCTEVYGDDDPAMRSELWGISKAHLPDAKRQRSYPQVFIKNVVDGGDTSYVFVADFHTFEEVNEMTGWIKGEMAKDPHFLETHDNIRAFVFEEKFADLLALFEPEKAKPTGSDGGSACTELYREAQVGRKCGKHAINAVLKNVGKDLVLESELNLMSEMVMEQSYGDDYSMGTLLFVLEGKMGPGTVQSVGERGGLYDEKPIQDLLKGVGTVEDINSVAEHLREGLKRQQFKIGIEDLDWIMCNSHDHWITFFKEPNGEFCDLNSMRVPMPPRQLPTSEVSGINCRGIIIPTSKGKTD